MEKPCQGKYSFECELGYSNCHTLDNRVDGKGKRRTVDQPCECSEHAGSSHGIMLGCALGASEQVRQRRNKETPSTESTAEPIIFAADKVKSPGPTSDLLCHSEHLSS